MRDKNHSLKFFSYKEQVARSISWGHYFIFINIILACILGYAYVYAAPPANTFLTFFYLGVTWLGHMSFLAVVSYLVIFFPLAFIGNFRYYRALAVLIAVILHTFLLFDIKIYLMVKAHLSWSSLLLMVQELDFDTGLNYNFLFIAIPLVIALECFFAKITTHSLYRDHHPYLVRSILIIVGVSFCTSHLLHIWADASRYDRITLLRSTFPVHYPMTARSFLHSHGWLNDDESEEMDASTAADYLKYPLDTLEVNNEAPLRNVIVITLNGLSSSNISPEQTPALSRLQKRSENFTNHYLLYKNELDNLFSLSYGLPLHYRRAMNSAQFLPVAVDEMFRQDYVQRVILSEYKVPPVRRSRTSGYPLAADPALARTTSLAHPNKDSAARADASAAQASAAQASAVNASVAQASIAHANTAHARAANASAVHSIPGAASLDRGDATISATMARAAEVRSVLDESKPEAESNLNLCDGLTAASIIDPSCNPLFATVDNAVLEERNLERDEVSSGTTLAQAPEHSLGYGLAHDPGPVPLIHAVDIGKIAHVYPGPGSRRSSYTEYELSLVNNLGLRSQQLIPTNSAAHAFTQALQLLQFYREQEKRAVSLNIVINDLRDYQQVSLTQLHNFLNGLDQATTASSSAASAGANDAKTMGSALPAHASAVSASTAHSSAASAYAASAAGGTAAGNASSSPTLTSEAPYLDDVLNDIHPDSLIVNTDPLVKASLQYEYMLRQTDWAIGAFMQTLFNEHLLSDTLIIITASEGNQLLGNNMELFDRQVQHVPLMVFWPDGGNAGKEVTTLTSAQDISATIAQDVVHITTPCNKFSLGWNLKDIPARPYLISESSEGLILVGEQDNIVYLQDGASYIERNGQRLQVRPNLETLIRATRDLNRFLR